MSGIFRLIKSLTVNKIPLIPIEADNISLLSSPDSFYTTLIDHVRRSQERIILSALYLGTGPKEQTLIDEIEKAMKNNENLRVNIILDPNRGTRLDQDGNSSKSILSKLSQHRNFRTNLNQAQPGSRLDEMKSTIHSKLFIFDDNVIVSGANLSNIYFENRLDRYMLFKDSKSLCDYFEKLMKLIGNSKDVASDEIINLNRSWSEKLCETSETFVVPLIQHGKSGIRDEEMFLQTLLHDLHSDVKCKLSAGYFNPTHIFDNLRAMLSVVAPSEESNGFYQAKGILGAIPRLYTCIQKQFLQRNNEASLHVFHKPGWTFHAKGIWIDNMSECYINFIGSSNYNYRSHIRDFEVQLALVTSNSRLTTTLKQESDRIWKDSSLTKIQDLETPFYLNILSRIFKSFL